MLRKWGGGRGGSYVLTLIFLHDGHCGCKLDLGIRLIMCPHSAEVSSSGQETAAEHCPTVNQKGNQPAGPSNGTGMGMHGN